jgi:V-type H+-transporting ATPase subunit H
MSLDPPAYILSLQNNIRARPISWEGAVRAKTITDADLQKIKAIDKVRKEQRKQVIEKDADSYVELFLGNGKDPSIFQAAAKRPDIVQYMLVLAGDLIDGMQGDYLMVWYIVLTRDRHSHLRLGGEPAHRSVQAIPAPP